MTADEGKAEAARLKAATSYLHQERAKELIAIAMGVGISMEESTALIAGRLVEWEKESPLAEKVRRFFDYLDREEESDSGRVFHPVSMGCCRAAWVEDLNQTVADMKRLAHE